MRYGGLGHAARRPVAYVRKDMRGRGVVFCAFDYRKTVCGAKIIHPSIIIDWPRGLAVPRFAGRRGLKRGQLNVFACYARAHCKERGYLAMRPLPRFAPCIPTSKNKTASHNGTPFAFCSMRSRRRPPNIKLNLSGLLHKCEHFFVVLRNQLLPRRRL